MTPNPLYARLRAQAVLQNKTLRISDAEVDPTIKETEYVMRLRATKTPVPNFTLHECN